MFIQSISILSDIFNHHCILSDIFYWILHYMEWDVVIGLFRLSMTSMDNIVNKTWECVSNRLHL